MRVRGDMGRKLNNALTLTFRTGPEAELGTAVQASGDGAGKKLGVLFGFKNGGPGTHVDGLRAAHRHITAHQAVTDNGDEHGLRSDRNVEDLELTVLVRDRVVRVVEHPEVPVHPRVDGALVLDRGALRRMVFADRAELDALNAIVHPEVATLRDARIAELAHREDLIVVYAIPLLFEANMADEFDRIILVGGSTRIPAVQDAIKKFFGGKAPDRSINPD